MIAYCGTAPTPQDLLFRWNLDPYLIFALASAAAWQWQYSASRLRLSSLAGWAVAALAFMSPLCALSVALFSARIGQHMILMLVAAPLIAAGLPGRPTGRWLWPSAWLFLGALWLWHMPRPYAETFASTTVYWLMHLSLFGTAVFHWRQLLSHRATAGLQVVAAGTFTCTQMSLLGALLTLAARPLFAPHLETTQAFGLTALADQQLGGVLMWVPGILLFLGIALRAASRAAMLAEELR